MDDSLVIVARITAAEGAAERLQAEMKTLVADTRQEAGCLSYDLHRGVETPELFVFTERWQSHALWRAHMEGTAIEAFNRRIGEGAIASAEIMQLTTVA